PHRLLERVAAYDAVAAHDLDRKIDDLGVVLPSVPTQLAGLFDGHRRADNPLSRIASKPRFLQGRPGFLTKSARWSQLSRERQGNTVGEGPYARLHPEDPEGEWKHCPSASTTTASS